MGKKILAVIVGVVTAGVVVFIVEAIGHWAYPLPPGTNVRDPEAMKSLIATLPAGALLFVVLGWTLGSFAGGAVAARIGRSLGPGLVTGAIQLLFGIITMFMIHHPMWMVALGTLLPIPAAWAGAALLGGAKRV